MCVSLFLVRSRLLQTARVSSLEVRSKPDYLGRPLPHAVNCVLRGTPNKPHGHGSPLLQGLGRGSPLRTAYCVHAVEQSRTP